MAARASKAEQQPQGPAFTESFLFKTAEAAIVAMALERAGAFIGRELAQRTHNINEYPKFKQEASQFAADFNAYVEKTDASGFDQVRTTLQRGFQQKAAELLTKKEATKVDNYLDARDVSTRRGKKAKRIKEVRALGEHALAAYREIKLRDDDTFENDANGKVTQFAQADGHKKLIPLIAGKIPVLGVDHATQLAQHTVNAAQEAEEDIQIHFVRQQMGIFGIDRGHIGSLDNNDLKWIARQLFPRKLHQEARHAEDRLGDQKLGIFFLAMAHHLARPDLTQQQQRDILATAFISDRLATRKAQLAQEAQQAQATSQPAAK